MNVLCGIFTFILTCVLWTEYRHRQHLYKDGPDQRFIISAAFLIQTRKSVLEKEKIAVGYFVNSVHF